jgi:hypothetical protein
VIFFGYQCRAHQGGCPDCQLADADAEMALPLAELARLRVGTGTAPDTGNIGPDGVAIGFCLSLPEWLTQSMALLCGRISSEWSDQC